MFDHVRRWGLSAALASMIVGLPSSVLAGGHQNAKARCISDAPVSLSAILGDLERVKENRDYEDIPTFWDQTDANPFYIAEEVSEVMTDWPTIEAYWQSTKATSGWIDVEYDLISHKCLGPSDVLVLFDLRWDMSVDGFDNPIGGSNRVLAGLRLIEDQWKFHTWVEAPLAALIYMQKLYEKNVRPEVLEEQGLQD